MTPEQAAEAGYADGEADGFMGEPYDAYDATVPPELDAVYRQEYGVGYREGQIQRNQFGTWRKF